MNDGRVVFDTNTLVSAILLKNSVPDQAFQKARQACQLLFSAATLEELEQVLLRKKFDRYVSVSTRIEFLARISSSFDPIAVVEKIKSCRDPKDDKFLEVAVNGSADMIVTGDRDLFVLNPFRQIDILTPAQFLLR